MFTFDYGAWMNFTATNYQTIQNARNNQALAARVSSLFETNTNLLAEFQAISSTISEFEQYIKFGKDLPCPYCAQLISKHALVCNYCQGSLTIGNAESIRVAILSKPYLAARDAETIKQLMAEVSRITSEQQELQRIIAEIEDERVKQEKLKESEFRKNMELAAEAERIESEKKKKAHQLALNTQQEANIKLARKIIGLAPDKLRKAESILAKGKVDEFKMFVKKEESELINVIESLKSWIGQNNEVISTKSGSGTFLELTRDIKHEWLWLSTVGKLVSDYENSTQLRLINQNIRLVIDNDSSNEGSSNHLSIKIRTKFLILDALVLSKLGEQRASKKRIKQADGDYVSSCYKSFQIHCPKVESYGFDFFRDLCTAILGLQVVYSKAPDGI